MGTLSQARWSSPRMTVPGRRSRALEAEIGAAHGRVTNMKRTLAHSPVALRALMTWYDLRDEVEPFLGKRATVLFAHAISAGTDCLICSTFFRRLLIDAGDDPDDPELDDREGLVVSYGRQLARDPNGVSDELFARLSSVFSRRADRGPDRVRWFDGGHESGQ